MKFQGHIPNRSPEFYTKFLMPIVLLKKAVDSVRRYIDRAIWTELVKGEKVDNEILNLVLFIVFCLLSLLTFRLEKYQTSVIILFSCLWYVDRLLAKRRYFHGKERSVTSLTASKDGMVAWTMRSPLEEPRQMRFHRHHLSHIAIRAIRANGGAFDSAIARAWQVELILTDETNLLMYEEPRAIDAIDRARELADLFEVRIVFRDSEGQRAYADPAIARTSSSMRMASRNPTRNNAVGLTQTAQRWHIFSRWTFGHSWQFFGKVFHESGFLLFTLLLTRFMSRFGEMLDTLITYYRASEIVYLDFSGIFNFFFQPNLSWIDWIAVAIATTIAIGRGAQISQVKHVYIDRQKFRFAINRKEIRQFNLPEIEMVLLITQPEPLILICDRDRALEIRDLLREEDYRAMWIDIEQGIAHFQSA
ncbi:hypothetical protein [Pseudanabaena sp. PCC 6802]|uniref:hypothetical protein n=1 Tax=Pseudanabaena sp. PCC 6802 TaxID=118173 RepID=UPI0003492B2B|nr:hypothetical protein [Pseudanabaena sp. PCC 6802]